MWDSSISQELHTLKDAEDAEGVVSSVAYSPDGKRIVSGTGDSAKNEPGMVKVWDAAMGKQLLTLEGHLVPVNCVAYSPDGKRIVSGGGEDHQPGGELKVWNAHTGQELLTFEGCTNPVWSVAYSPDGRRIVSGSGSPVIEIGKPASGEVKVWDAATGKQLLSLKGHKGVVYSMAYSPDGKRIVSGSLDKTLKVWDAATGQDLLTLKGHTNAVSSVAYSPDGRRIVSGSSDTTLKVWDAQTGQNLLTLKGHAWNVRSVMYSPDGKRIVSGSLDKTLKVWDAATGQDLLTLKGHTNAVTGVAFSPDGRRIISSSRDNTVKVWDTQYGEDFLFLKGHTKDVNSVVFSPSGKRIFAWDTQGKVLTWDASNGMLLPNARKGMPAGNRVAVHGNRRAVVEGHLVRIKRILTPAEQQRLYQEEEFLHARAFHSDEATAAEQDEQPFAAVFHLDRLLPLLPDQRRDLLRRRHAILTAALKSNAGDAWAARALAHQAVSDPDSVADRKPLLTALAKQQNAPMDRVHGGLLLRTGSAREAAIVLRAAIRHRGADAPPVEELLLALAHVRLKQFAEARLHLRTTVAWMQRGSEPLRAAALAGLAARSPLAALGAVAVTPPDPRLVPLDPHTAYELTALRAEVEKALAKQKP